MIKITIIQVIGSKKNKIKGFGIIRLGPFSSSKKDVYLVPYEIVQRLVLADIEFDVVDYGT